MLKTEGTTFVDYGAPACTDKQTLSHARGFMIGDGANVSGGKTVAHRVFFSDVVHSSSRESGFKGFGDVPSRCEYALVYGRSHPYTYSVMWSPYPPNSSIQAS